MNPEKDLKSGWNFVMSPEAGLKSVEILCLLNPENGWKSVEQFVFDERWERFEKWFAAEQHSWIPPAASFGASMVSELGKLWKKSILVELVRWRGGMRIRRKGVKMNLYKKR